MEKTYAGIGARTTPDDVLRKMRNSARALAKMGFTLHSGGAEGADEAFEEGCDQASGSKRIFLPYRNFRRNQSELYGSCKEARRIAREFHPNWRALSNRGWDFMARNSYQVLGQELRSPVTFILCWTPNGKVVGGTGQALRLAEHFEIPVLNFGNMTDDDISEEIFKLDRKLDESN